MPASEYPAAREAIAGWQRRHEGGLRLMPMECGCRDPLSYQHRERRCPWRRRRVE